jgi:hypothetical protein
MILQNQTHPAALVSTIKVSEANLTVSEDF